VPNMAMLSPETDEVLAWSTRRRLPLSSSLRTFQEAVEAAQLLLSLFADLVSRLFCNRAHRRRIE
jgi:hypothetical protein